MTKLLLIPLLLVSTLTNASTEITYFLKSDHWGNKNDGTPYNENHKFIGVEYRYDDTGVAYAASRYVNSYGKLSFMVDTAQYWTLTDDIEVSARFGIATGYDGHSDCIKGRTVRYCPILSVGIAYTGYEMVIPKLSVSMGLLTFSLGMRF